MHDPGNKATHNCVTDGPIMRMTNNGLYQPRELSRIMQKLASEALDGMTNTSAPTSAGSRVRVVPHRCELSTNGHASQEEVNVSASHTIGR